MCLWTHFTLDLLEGSGAIYKCILFFSVPDFLKKEEKCIRQIYIELIPEQKNLISESLKEKEIKEMNSLIESSAYLKSYSTS